MVPKTRTPAWLPHVPQPQWARPTQVAPQLKVTENACLSLLQMSFKKKSRCLLRAREPGHTSGSRWMSVHHPLPCLPFPSKHHLSVPQPTAPPLKMLCHEPASRACQLRPLCSATTRTPKGKRQGPGGCRAVQVSGSPGRDGGMCPAYVCPGTAPGSSLPAPRPSEHSRASAAPCGAGSAPRALNLQIKAA